MDIIIFIIIAALGSIIFKDSKKRPSQSDQEPMSGPQSQPMTWEEMERQYGISIEHDDTTDSGIDPVEQSQSMESSRTVEPSKPVETIDTPKRSQSMKTVEPTVTVNNHREWERQAALLAAADKVRSIPSSGTLEVTRLGASKGYKNTQALRDGMKWSIILEKPKVLQHRAVR